ncbi:hypothetical protein FH972_005979 [Carpinus fangiana]|uniref:Uncharacterized protein n=1 Tax=Carpinus fangiana TaxID=176857 RepID=A0A5N6QSR4_9ROSI|nr:hypothetical protein FH972_005979 [Carpinus fangiana]
MFFFTHLQERESAGEGEAGAESSPEESTAEIGETQKPQNISAHSVEKPKNPKTSLLVGFTGAGQPIGKEEMLVEKEIWSIRNAQREMKKC